MYERIIIDRMNVKYKYSICYTALFLLRNPSVDGETGRTYLPASKLFSTRHSGSIRTSNDLGGQI